MWKLGPFFLQVVLWGPFASWEPQGGTGPRPDTGHQSPQGSWGDHSPEPALGQPFCRAECGAWAGAWGAQSPEGAGGLGGVGATAQQSLELGGCCKRPRPLCTGPPTPLELLGVPGIWDLPRRVFGPSPAAPILSSRDSGLVVSGRHTEQGQIPVKTPRKNTNAETLAERRCI